MRAALTYPVILAVASGAVIMFLLTFVVPTFSKIYGDMEGELPVATRMLVAVTGRLAAKYEHKYGKPFHVESTGPLDQVLYGLSLTGR